MQEFRDPHHTAMSETFVAALETAATGIFKSLGPLSDLPRDLGNTVANIYFRHSLMLWNPMDTSVAFSSDELKRVRNGLVDATTLYSERLAEVISAKEAMPETISAFRDIDPLQQPNARKAAEEFILDIFKYKISNAANKIGLRRMIERRFSKVDEIPNLIEKINPLINAIANRKRQR